MGKVSEKKSVPAIKVTMRSGRVAVLREPKILDMELCAKKVGRDKGLNPAEAQIKLQNELLRLLLLQIDGDEMTHDKKNDLDSILTFNEWADLQRMVQKLTGDDSAGEELAVEMI